MKNVSKRLKEFANLWNKTGKNWYLKGGTYKIAGFKSNDVLLKEYKELFPPPFRGGLGWGDLIYPLPLAPSLMEGEYLNRI